MANERWSDVLGAIEKQGERSAQQSRDTIEAVNLLAKEVRDFAKGVSEARAAPTGGRSQMQSMAAMFGLVVALVTPMFILIKGNTDNVRGIVQRMEQDNQRERVDAASSAQLHEQLRDVETQFRAVREMFDIETGHLQTHATRTEDRLWKNHSDNAAQLIRLQVLEARVSGLPMPVDP